VPLRVGGVAHVAHTVAPVAAGVPAGHVSFGWRLKRVVERGLAGALLVVLSPVIVLTALAIRVSGRGPIIHRRHVLGRHGVPFYAFKFRTMVADADARLHADPALRAQFEQQFKLARDPRVTPLGHLLRRSSLDEVPQLLNILRGEMALVGPRMISPEELARYGAHGARLLSVHPGLTGLWQVSGRQRTTYDERVRLDMEYIEHWTLGLDLKILALTIPAVLGASGAH
jgi:lipopolysaccharide/colanic/teichoic acid biosynthesis glycosyltransferase